MPLDAALASENFCYLTTRGRVSGRDHTIEIWFGLHVATAYLLATNPASDWVKNIQHTPAVRFRIGRSTFAGQGRLVSDPSEMALARRLVLEKYQPGYAEDLREWSTKALPVAIDLLAE